MSVSVMLFTSDLRVHDHPALSAAVREADEVVPLFVLDAGVTRAGFAVPNRRAFLADSLASLDAGLRERGGRLVVRAGEVTEQVCRIVTETGARTVHLAAGVSAYARRREDRLRTALTAARCALRVHDAVITALPSGAMTPVGQDCFTRFTPYAHQWERTAPRRPLAAPARLTVPELPGRPLPRRAAVAGVSPALARGGEREGRLRLSAWLDESRHETRTHAGRSGDLPGDAASRLSPHLHFGTLSAAELVHRARQRGGRGAEAFVRRLALRDFRHQVLASRPEAAFAGRPPHGDGRGITAWKEGRTGCPLVDAGMRQLLHEGWMPHRARLLTAEYLVRALAVDWRFGARHFLDLLVDGDVADTRIGWLHTATAAQGTAAGGCPPLAEAERHDPYGDYVRRWVPELAALPGAQIHRPDALDPRRRARLGYPAPRTPAQDSAHPAAGPDGAHRLPRR